MDTLRSIQVNSRKHSALNTQFSIKVLIALFLLTLLSPLNAYALTIDNFKEGGKVVSDVVGVSDTDNISGTAIGGNRNMYTIKTAGFSLNTLETFSNSLLHSSIAGTGISRITWDGDSVDDFNPTGLGGIDLMHDGTGDPNQDGIIVNVFFLDDSHPVTLKITAYSNGTKFSSLEKTLVEAINWPTVTKPDGETIMFLFKDFQTVGGEAVDFTDIGALQLEIIQGTAATDLIITKVMTNGCNDEVPDANTDSKDRCGVVCGNDACVDCLDVPNGSALPGTSCDTGLDGICSDGVWEGSIPSCNCKQNEDPTNEICDGLDNNCDGSVDEPFDNLGDDCSVGVDDCAINGVFECDDDGGVRCSADDRKDDADECDASRGCDGVPYSGLVFDACGVCGGDDMSCADCEGVPNGTKVIDRCGVCGGDGNGCLICDKNDVTDIQTSLDSTVQKIAGFSRRLKILIIEEAKAAFKSGKINRRERQSTIKFARTSYKEQKTSADKAWQTLWTKILSVFDTCSNSFCVSTSNEGPVNEFLAINEQMQNVNEAQANELKNLAIKTRSKSARRRAARLRKRTRNGSTQNTVNADSVPLIVSNCS